MKRIADTIKTFSVPTILKNYISFQMPVIIFVCTI